MKELETSRLFKELEGIGSCQSTHTGAVVSSNLKLKYHIKHLNEVVHTLSISTGSIMLFQSISLERSKGMKYMTNVLSVINGVFTHAIRNLYPEFGQLKNVLQYSGAKFGDYKCMAAMPIAQVW